MGEAKNSSRSCSKGFADFSGYNPALLKISAIFPRNPSRHWINLKA